MWTSPERAYLVSIAIESGWYDLHVHAALERTGRFLFVTWQSGGGTQPEIGLARLLSTRGHAVRVLAPSPQRARIEAVGSEWRPFPREAEFDPSRGRALEDQEDFVVSTVFGIAVPRAALAEVERDPPDVLVVDYQLRNVLSAGERTGLPTVAIVHTAHRFHGVVSDADSVRMTYGMLNETRSQLGLPALSPSDEVTTSVATIRRCARALVVMPSQFDTWADPPPPVVHVGPIFEEDPHGVEIDLPWAAEDPDPAVVVSLSSQYMHQESALERISDAIEGLPVRMLITTGHELLPEEVRDRPGVLVRSYVPHVALLPRTSLVVTHGGMGTIMAAFACGVPLVCIPLGRDQPGNAGRVQELGAGLALPSDASSEAIRAAIAEALGSDPLRAGAKRMAEAVGRYEGGIRAVTALEDLLTG